MERQKLFHKYLCEKRVCASSLTTLKREFRTLRWNIFAKPFCLFIWAQVESFKQKNYRKSHDIVLLRLKEWSFFTYRVDGCSHNHVKVFSLFTIMKVCQMTFLPKTEIFFYSLYFAHFILNDFFVFETEVKYDLLNSSITECCPGKPLKRRCVSRDVLRLAARVPRLAVRCPRLSVRCPRLSVRCPRLAVRCKKN